MSAIYWASVTLHVLAALFWLGGMFFLAAVGAPVLRKVEDARLRRDLFGSLGEQFRRVGWGAIGVLIFSGLANLHFQGVLRWDVLSSADFWSQPFGRALFWKLMTVAVMLTIQAVHDFIHGPAAGRAEPGSAEALRMRGRAAWLARINAVVGVVLVYVAVRLARGGMS